MTTETVQEWGCVWQVSKDMVRNVGEMQTLDFLRHSLDARLAAADRRALDGGAWEFVDADESRFFWVPEYDWTDEDNPVEIPDSYHPPNAWMVRVFVRTVAA